MTKQAAVNNDDAQNSLTLATSQSEAYIFNAQVMHKRYFPKKNAFIYRLFYLTFPFAERSKFSLGRLFKMNGWGFSSFQDHDHGYRSKEQPNEEWLADIFAQYGLPPEGHGGPIILICLPRVLGYVFNPVSFWICYDQQKNIRSVICEVNNTFGETHSYYCAHEDHKPIVKDDILMAEKVFHVSPFLEREGEYSFQFDLAGPTLNIQIDFYDADNKKKLKTALYGTLEPLNRRNMLAALVRIPLETLKAITLIHWQAAKLFFGKKAIFYKKPQQLKEKVTRTKTNENP